MNERITELYVQANKYASDAGFKKYDKAGDVNWKWEDTVFEKFAELIVKECGVALNTMLRDQISRGQAYDLIKKHFRIEE